jgi:hypothetical protein
MADYITLLGAEQVQNAGHAISNAASEMRQAGNNIHEAAETMRRNMDDFLDRFERILEKDRQCRG